MRPADRSAGRLPCPQLVFVQLEALLAQGGGHAQRALLAVGEELRQPRRESGAGVVDAVPEDVQFARCSDPALLPVRVDRGDLHRGDHLHAVALAGAQRLGDAAHRVVVGQRQQLHPRPRGPLHHLGGRQCAVGVG